MVLTRLATWILFVSIVYLSGASAVNGPAGHKKMQRKPCKQLKLFMHNILYMGQNAANATAAIVAAPKEKPTVAEYLFGDVVVFDDPVTLDNNLHSRAVGRAQGIYVYDSKETFSALMGFVFILNSTEHQGSINFFGANPYVTMKSRDISVVGGTGDFAMARGIATLVTDAVELPVYFRVSIDIKLYECW